MCFIKNENDSKKNKNVFHHFSSAVSSPVASEQEGQSMHGVLSECYGFFPQHTDLHVRLTGNFKVLMIASLCQRWHCDRMVTCPRPVTAGISRCLQGVVFIWKKFVEVWWIGFNAAHVSATQKTNTEETDNTFLFYTFTLSLKSIPTL